MLSTDLSDFKSITMRHIDEHCIEIRDQSLQMIADSISELIDDLNKDSEALYDADREEIHRIAEKRKNQLQQWLEENRDTMEAYREKWEQVILHMISIVCRTENQLLDEAHKSHQKTVENREAVKTKIIQEKQVEFQTILDQMRALAHDAINKSETVAEVMEYSHEFMMQANAFESSEIRLDGDKSTMHRMTSKKNIHNIRNTLSFSEERALLKKIAITHSWDEVDELLNLYCIKYAPRFIA